MAWKKIVAVLLFSALLTGLYVIELSKIQVRESDRTLNLDELESNASGKLWDLFYRVRVKIIDGRSAAFDMPAELLELNGEEIELEGAVAFRSEGNRFVDNNHIAVAYFDLLPLVTLTYACDIAPDVYMRWTVVVSLRDEWVLTREQMIDAEVAVRGRFRIDTSEPYNAAFFIDDAKAVLLDE